MAKLVITHGCSFTRYKWDCWPKFLSWFENDINVRNFGHSASSNETIAREVVNSALKYKNIHKMYIMWSGSDRYEVVCDKEETHEHEIGTYSRFDPDFNWCVWFGGHPDKKQHENYQRHFLNERHNWFRTLEKILYTQMFLNKHKINYKMMIYKVDVLKHDNLSNAERVLYNQINWRRFIFYKEKLGLYEFAHELYPKQFAEESDEHPLPFTHYKWVKDIIFKSYIEPPKEEYIKLKEWKTLNLKKKN
jgi:hypothetical protein